MTSERERAEQLIKEKFKACYPPAKWAVVANGIEVANAINFANLTREWDGFQKGWQAASEVTSPMIKSRAIGTDDYVIDKEVAEILFPHSQSKLCSNCQPIVSDIIDILHKHNQFCLMESERLHDIVVSTLHKEFSDGQERAARRIALRMLTKTEVLQILREKRPLSALNEEQP